MWRRAEPVVGAPARHNLSMRIVGGRNRGLRLAEVGAGDAAAHLRPTSDRVRESLFNMLCQGRWGDLVSGVRVLDLFAGTGALGLEALSRGAAHATFVDSGKPARALIADNIGRAGRVDDAAVLALRADALPPASAACALVFVDPPYGKSLGASALVAAAAQGWIGPRATIVWEESTAQPPPPGFSLRDSRRYGQTWITLLVAP